MSLFKSGVTGTKTLVVHGQNECDIPTQLPVHEDTQFEALLKVGGYWFIGVQQRQVNIWLGYQNVLTVYSIVTQNLEYEE